MLSPEAVHETVLYGDNVPALAEFYSRVMGLRLLPGADEQGAALRMPTGDAVLLLFHPSYAATPGRGVPTHGATGPGHIAFRVAYGSLDHWIARFAELGVAVELDRTWKRGGRSLYVRDPAGNSVELVEGDIWPA